VAGGAPEAPAIAVGSLPVLPAALVAPAVGLGGAVAPPLGAPPWPAVAKPMSSSSGGLAVVHPRATEPSKQAASSVDRSITEAPNCGVRSPH
jgi:hypothetical protein